MKRTGRAVEGLSGPGTPGTDAQSARRHGCNGRGEKSISASKAKKHSRLGPRRLGGRGLALLAGLAEALDGQGPPSDESFSPVDHLNQSCLSRPPPARRPSSSKALDAFECLLQSDAGDKSNQPCQTCLGHGLQRHDRNNQTLQAPGKRWHRITKSHSASPLCIPSLKSAATRCKKRAQHQSHPFGRARNKLLLCRKGADDGVVQRALRSGECLHVPTRSRLCSGAAADRQTTLSQQVQKDLH